MSRPGAIRWAAFPFGRRVASTPHPPERTLLGALRLEPRPADSIYEVRMTAVLYQIRDYQSAKEIERMQRELEKEAAAILSETVPFGGQGIDGMVFTAPDSDPA
jgi:hypothetical protein